MAPARRNGAQYLYVGRLESVRYGFTWETAVRRRSPPPFPPPCHSHTPSQLQPPQLRPCPHSRPPQASSPTPASRGRRPRARPMRSSRRPCRAAPTRLSRVRHREPRALDSLSGAETAAAYTGEIPRNAPRRRTGPTTTCPSRNAANCCLTISGDLKAAAARGAAATATAKGLTRSRPKPARATTACGVT